MFHGWNVVAVCMLVFGLANGITAYSYGVLVFPMGAEFGAGRGELMLGMTVSSFVSILCAPLLGNLIDKGQARLLFSGAALLLGLELLLISFASSVWVFVAIFALTTPVVGSLLGPVGTNTVVARWFSRQRARALGILAMGTSIGGLLAVEKSNVAPVLSLPPAVMAVICTAPPVETFCDPLPSVSTAFVARPSK